MHEMQYCNTYAWNTIVTIKSYKKPNENWKAKCVFPFHFSMTSTFLETS